MRFRERLSVPVLWWVLAAGFALSLLVALWFSVGPVWGIGGAALSLIIAVWLFARSAVLLVVDRQVLRIGRAEIDYPYVAGCRALDPETTRRRAGIDADARAHLVLRPYIGTAVEITLADPADPVPYWLVSSRRPAMFAAALAAAIGPRSAQPAEAASGQDDSPHQRQERSSTKGATPLNPRARDVLTDVEGTRHKLAE